jgi:trimethylamine:corrinoid methyltransferase-like protein
MDRQPWVNWEAAGAPTLHDRLKMRLRDILATHRPPPLPDGAEEKIRAILQAAGAREEQRR